MTTTQSPTSTLTHLDATKLSWVMEGRLPPQLTRTPAAFQQLWNLRPAEKAKWRFMGKVSDVPRYTQSFNLPSYFSGLDHVALPVPSELHGLWAWVNGLGYGDFNEILMNWYPDGSSYIGKHSDVNMKEGTPVVSISFGQSRTFRVRSREDGKIVRDFLCTDGSWLIMGGRMQKVYTHEIPKVGGKKGAEMGKRINITFRQFPTEAEKQKQQKGQKADQKVTTEKKSVVESTHNVSGAVEGGNAKIDKVCNPNAGSSRGTDGPDEQGTKPEVVTEVRQDTSVTTQRVEVRQRTIQDLLAPPAKRPRVE